MVHVFEGAGIQADRTAPLQAGIVGEADVRSAIPLLFIECKRQERLNIPLWLRELEECCPEGRIPILAFRRNGRPHHPEPWRAVVPLEWLAEMLAEHPSRKPLLDDDPR